MRLMITQDRIKTLVVYMPETGLMYWREREGMKAWNKRFSGKKVGANIHGYIRAPFDGVFHPIHRMAWLYVYGVYPEGEIDHINGEKSDNRITNLRDVSHACNGRNQKKSKSNTSGFMGVSKSHGKWIAFITVNRERIWLGRFRDKSDAVKARREAEKEYGFHENHGR